MKRHKKQKTNLKHSTHKSSNFVSFGFALVFAALGVYLLTRSFAATSGVALNGFVNSDNGIHRAVGTNDVTNPQLLNGNIDYVWSTGGGFEKYAPSVHYDYYIPFNQLSKADNGGHDLAWFQTNHPDWLDYTCDSKGQPTRNPAYFNSHTNLIPVDWSNPAVQQWEFSYVKQILSGPPYSYGYSGIGWDLFTWGNVDSSCGVYKGGPSNPWGGWTYLGYPGTDQINAAFTNDMTSWLKYMSSQIHALGYTLTVNSRIGIGNGYLGGVVNYPTAYPLIDADWDEYTFENAALNQKTTDNKWQARVAGIDTLNAAGKAEVLSNTIDLSQDRNGQFNWIMANYLLLKGPKTYVTIDQTSPTGVFEDFPEFHTPIGSPTSNRYASQGVYMRNYSGGLAIVNPSSTASFKVNLGKTYKDMYGNTLSSLTLAPATGMVLVNPPAVASTGSAAGTSSSKAATAAPAKGGSVPKGGAGTNSSNGGGNTPITLNQAASGSAKSSAAGSKIEEAKVKAKIFVGTSILCFITALLYVLRLHRSRSFAFPVANVDVHTADMPEPKPLNGNLPHPGTVINPKGTEPPPT